MMNDNEKIVIGSGSDAKEYIIPYINSLYIENIAKEVDYILTVNAFNDSGYISYEDLNDILNDIDYDLYGEENEYNDDELQTYNDDISTESANNDKIANIKFPDNFNHAESQNNNSKEKIFNNDNNQRTDILTNQPTDVTTENNSDEISIEALHKLQSWMPPEGLKPLNRKSSSMPQALAENKETDLKNSGANNLANDLQNNVNSVEKEDKTTIKPINNDHLTAVITESDKNIILNQNEISAQKFVRNYDSELEEYLQNKDLFKQFMLHQKNRLAGKNDKIEEAFKEKNENNMNSSMIHEQEIKYDKSFINDDYQLKNLNDDYNSDWTDNNDYETKKLAMVNQLASQKIRKPLPLRSKNILPPVSYYHKSIPNKNSSFQNKFQQKDDYNKKHNVKEQDEHGSIPSFKNEKNVFLYLNNIDRNLNSYSFVLDAECRKNILNLEFAVQSLIPLRKNGSRAKSFNTVNKKVNIFIENEIMPLIARSLSVLNYKVSTQLNVKSFFTTYPLYDIQGHSTITMSYNNNIDIAA